jgi:hypothetical protein
MGSEEWVVSDRAGDCRAGDYRAGQAPPLLYTNGGTCFVYGGSAHQVSVTLVCVFCVLHPGR